MATVNVLIASGDTAGADELRSYAESAGFQVMECENSVKGAVVFTESLNPDIVLMDTVLFEKRKLPEILKEIQIVGNIPVILIIDAEEDIPELFLESNRPYGVLVRPFGQILFKLVVEEAIYRHSIKGGENNRGKRMHSGAVVRKVAHDINNSLSSALANIQLARRSCTLDRNQCRHLDDAENGILRARDQSRQLLMPSVVPMDETGAARMVSTHEHRRQNIARKKASTLGKYRILLMDDEDSILSATSEMLSFLGHIVTIAKTGEEAIAFFRKAKDNALPFDAVILDITVPGGMGAEETLPLLREIEPGVRAIISSGYATHPLLISFAANGFSAALIKPYGFKELEESLGQLSGLIGL